jgi:hypothetical protein
MKSPPAANPAAQPVRPESEAHLQLSGKPGANALPGDLVFSGAVWYFCLTFLTTYLAEYQ